MKKGIKKLIFIIALFLAAGIYYYVALPAINIHSSGFWWFIIAAVAVITIVIWFKSSEGTEKLRRSARSGVYKIDFGKTKLPVKIGVGIIVALFLVFIAGSILSSPIVNAKKYQQLMTVEDRNFTEDITQVDFDTIPLLDKDSAALLGNRKMGSMMDMVSQFEVADDYTQLNYQGVPVRVTPLKYASAIKWLTNQKDGIPAYMRIDMTTQDTECVQLEQGIRYSKSEYFNRNLYRHLRFNFPTYIFSEQLFFEIDDNGHPYWICPVKKFNIGLFGGQTVGRVVVCDAVTGECIDYAVEDTPQWIDKVFQAELLMGLYDYYGTLQHGFFNSILSQRDCLQTTNGYNYIALEDDVWVYSGVTSVSGDQSNVGFVLMNQRTMETRFYRIEGAIEDSAMASAEGQVQHLGYQATFPLLLNIADEPTYFMALKDAEGLVKMYAMVNIQKYQWVAIGNTVQECEKAYNELLNVNGIVAKETGMIDEAEGVVKNIVPVVVEGNTHIYLSIEGEDRVFDVDLTKTELVSVVKYSIGDRIRVSYVEGDDLVTVVEIVE